jgi:hypothetical protein
VSVLVICVSVRQDVLGLALAETRRKSVVRSVTSKIKSVRINNLNPIEARLSGKRISDFFLRAADSLKHAVGPPNSFLLWS